MRGTSWDQPHIQLMHTAVRMNHKSDDAEQGQGLKAGHQSSDHIGLEALPTARGRLKLISVRMDEVTLREEDHFLETDHFGMPYIHDFRNCSNYGSNGRQ